MNRITTATVIQPVPEKGPVRRAADALMRDIRKTCLPGAAQGIAIRLEQADYPPEQYTLALTGAEILLRAGDDLGFVYGLYRISRDILGVEPFWFWNDQRFIRRRSVEIPCGETVSRPSAVRYRGWFINDEVLLHAWSVDGSREKPWEMAFEALLRLGGNLHTARTGALFTLVMSQLIHVFECKSEEKKLFSVPYLNNIFLLVSVAISFMCLIAAIYVPILQTVFSTVPLNTVQLLWSLCTACAVPVLSSLFPYKK